MFWIKWAYKNLISNQKRTMGIVVFILFTLAIIMIDLMFLAGTDRQMRESIRNNRGDLNIRAKGLNQNILPVFKRLNQKDSRLIEANLKIYKEEVQLIGAQGYTESTVIGAGSTFMKYLNRNVSWVVRPDFQLKKGTAVIEAVLAEKLNLKKGSLLTLQARTEKGMINTVQVLIDGIFVGSNLLYSNMVFINFADQNLLFMVKNQFNEIRVYFHPQVSDDDLIGVLKDVSKYFYKICNLESPRLDPTKDSIFFTFVYYRFLLMFIFWMLNAVFILILYFSIQNIFFMTFRERREEISTLLTYGMKPSRIKLVVFWESLFLFGAAFIAAIIGATIAIGLLNNLAITDPNIADLIVALGGPKLRFALDPAPMAAMIGFLLLITLYSAYKGANNYLKMEVREIISAA